jgi:hypothetical protein
MRKLLVQRPDQAQPGRASGFAYLLSYPKRRLPCVHHFLNSAASGLLVH